MTDLTTTDHYTDTALHTAQAHEMLPKPTATETISTNPAKTGGFTLSFRTAAPIYTPLIDLVPEDALYADSDQGNANRFLDIYKEKVHYCEAEKCWYVFDDVRWKIDETKAVLGMARDALYASYTKEIEALEHASGAKEFARLQQLYKKRDKAGNYASIQNCLNMAAIETAITPDVFDANLYWFHAQNGAIDLGSKKQNEFQGVLYHKPGHYFTKTAGTRFETGDAPAPPDGYLPGFPFCPHWIKFVLECCNKDMELYYYLQKAAGYSILTGDISEQKVFCLLGQGRNGKSLFINTLAEIAGDYASKIEASVLCTNRFGDKDSDLSKELYRIKGSRFVYSNEFGRNATLNENFVKTITDGGKLACRPLYGASIEYKPTYTLWFSTNHMPALSAMDEGIRRRVVVIPFRNNLTEAQVDHSLARKFRAEYPAILTWLIQGYDLYQKQGLIPPAAVQDSTKGYFTEQDLFSMFVDEHYTIDANGKVYAQNVYNTYRHWCEMNGEKYVSQTVLGKELQRLGITRERDRSGYYYTLALKE